MIHRKGLAQFLGHGEVSNNNKTNSFHPLLIYKSHVINN